MEGGQSHGVSTLLVKSSNENEFVRRVAMHMRGIIPENRLEKLSWSKAVGASFIYCFFGGHVWITHGGRWYNKHISSDIKPPKAVPSSPVNRQGDLIIEAKVRCGECLLECKLDYEKLKKSHPVDWPKADVEIYFISRGWRVSEEQGWLCKECG